MEDLVPGRDCGSCNVCCVALTIDDPALQKPQGYRCRNARPDNACAIYDTRPDTCRTFFCGWRRFRWIREPLRPDRSGVLVRQHDEVSKDTGEHRQGVIITLLTNAALKSEGLAETVAAAIAAGVPTFLNVPGPPGHTSARARINDALADVVAFKDKPGLLDLLRRMRAKAAKGRFEPINLKPRLNPSQPGPSPTPPPGPPGPT